MPRRSRRSRELSSPPPSDDDDDDEALGTADLTLHILAKAEQLGRDRARNNVAGAPAAAPEFEHSVRSKREVLGKETGGAASQRVELDEQDDTPIRFGDASEPEAGEVPVLSEKAKKKKKRKEREKKEKEKKERKEKRKREECTASANVVKMEDTKAETDETAEMKLPDAEGSLAMRKLLRGPRYFDPPEDQETCYNCGQPGHRAADCAEPPRQKPCFVCGNFGHDGYDCPEKTECFECGKSGHVARNCPNKQYHPRKFTGVCLLCGRLGHDVPSCSGEYDPDDFKHVHCYICKKPGHLCCIEVVDANPTPVSCYQCGDQGHTGLECTRQNGDRGDRSSCYRCGEEGHFARECVQSSRDYNIKQRRHSWPAPWSADNGRYRDQEPSFTPACQIRPLPFRKRLEQAEASSDKKKNEDSRKGRKRKRKESGILDHSMDNGRKKAYR